MDLEEWLVVGDHVFCSFVHFLVLGACEGVSFEKE